MPRRRDRHERGLRGPLALPNPYTSWVARPPRPVERAEFFADCVHASVRRLTQTCPEALIGVRIGVEDVPYLNTNWSGDQVPLAAAIEATETEPGQVVVYRRPLEHRTTTRQSLRELVHRTIVEQLSALTGLEVAHLDPDVEDDLG